MKLYFAGLVESSEDIRQFVIENIPELRVLISYFYTKVDKAIERGFKHIFLDCGAYSAWTKGIEINLEDYTKYCQNLPPEVEVIAALDVIGDDWASLRNWEYMREKGVNALPTYHFGDDPEVLKVYAENADYVALGGTVGRVKTVIAEFLKPIFSKYPNHRFHGFGIGSPLILKEFPFFSADATTWNVGSRFGQLLLEDGSRIPAGKKLFRVDDLRIREEIKAELNLQIDDDEFRSDTLDKENLLALHQLLAIDHGQIDFSSYNYQPSLF